MDISIIIIEYKCIEDVLVCIDSIKRCLLEVKCEFIVVSNSCYSKEFIVSLDSDKTDVRIVVADKNLGYAGAVNLGSEFAVGEFIYIVNPDVVFKDGLVLKTISDMRLDNRWAISGPKVVDSYGSVQPSCRGFPYPWTFLVTRSFFRKLPLFYPEQERYFMKNFSRDFRKDVDWLSGGALLVKRSIFLEVGGMDKRFFLYMEDVDFCRTLSLKGYKVIYCPESVVTHNGRHKSIKFKLTTLKHTYWHLSSLIKYFMKHNI